MKNYLFVSAVGMMMLAACSNDDAIPVEMPEAPSGGEITLSINSSGDGMETRAGRPVNSSEAANNVTAVKLYIYNASGVDVTSTALSAGIQNPFAWTAGPTSPSTPGTTDHKASQTIKLNKLSTDGMYTVVAYGYNALPTNILLDYTISNGGNGNDAFTATLPALTSESELFAGRATFNVVSGNVVAGTTNEVVMKRQVAGLLGYFKNVPVLYPNPNANGLPTVVAFVRVYASSHSNAFTFPSILAVNGTGNNTQTRVIEFDLSSILTDFATQTASALLNFDLSKVFNTAAVTTGGVQTVANSMLKGKFLIPFAKVAATTTFTVKLESATGAVLKSWDIVNNASADKKVYDVQRNYFYSIGQKVKAGATDGGTPGAGNPGDDDQPIDLSQETVINLTVNDAWDTIYNLGLE